jgi:hypothetical protein
MLRLKGVILIQKANIVGIEKLGVVGVNLMPVPLVFTRVVGNPTYFGFGVSTIPSQRGFAQNVFKVLLAVSYNKVTDWNGLVSYGRYRPAKILRSD